MAWASGRPSLSSLLAAVIAKGLRNEWELLLTLALTVQNLSLPHLRQCTSGFLLSVEKMAVRDRQLHTFSIPLLNT